MKDAFAIDPPAVYREGKTGGRDELLTVICEEARYSAACRVPKRVETSESLPKHVPVTRHPIE